MLANQSTRSETAARGIGGKAKRLLELQLAGFRVPEFVCGPADVAAAVSLLGSPLVVRSSASAEDGHDVSFAGQFKSFLNLRDAGEVRDAIGACERSLDAPSVAEYCRANGIQKESLRMGVIVQRMIEPELAGIAFTIDPMTGREEVVIEACEGLADALLQGSAPSLSPGHPLLEQHREEIERTARAVQRHFGEPQDIEFAIQDGELYLLQARPVTRINFAPETGEWTNADFRDGGVSCSVCTPLMWSLYDYIWQDALNGFLREIKLLRRGEGDFEAGRLFFGRPYWNLGKVKDCLASLPGFIERKFDEDLNIFSDYEGDGRVTPVSLKGILRAIPAALAVSSVWKKQARFDRDFLNGGFEDLASGFESIPANSAATLRGLIEGAYRVTETNYFRTVFCASLAKLDFAEAFPEAADTALVGGLPPIRHLEPARAMREMAARGDVDVDELMTRFRHHSRNELDLRAPRWDEDREWVEMMRECPPQDPGEGPRRAYEESLARHLSTVPRRRRKSFLRKLHRLRHFLWLREEMRDLSTRLYYLIRRHVLAIAGERNLGEDIFFMTWQEILRDDRSGIAAGRESFESYRNFAAPNEIGTRFAHGTPRDHSGDCLRGIAASPGVACGTVAVARDVTEAMRTPAGAILVCPFTDPGWTAVLGRVAGVVTENGGLLSHAAVICREYGIPAVLGVPEATGILPDGGQVTIDGDRGSVMIGTINEGEGG